MRSKTILFFVVLLLIAAAVGSLSVFTVDRTEFVYLTQFGRHVATYDGADDDEAGLHFNWPWPDPVGAAPRPPLAGISICRGRSCSPATPRATPSTRR